MLAREAVAAGARLFEETTFRGAEPSGAGWRIRLARTRAAEASGFGLEAALLVDATGRRAQVARTLGGRRHVFDGLVGIATRWSSSAPDERGHLLVESAPDGWWYSAPLPGGRDSSNAMVAMFLTDADVCAAERLSALDAWSARLRSTVATRRRLIGTSREGLPEVHCARSHRLRRADGDRRAWIATGDAALAVDPISGSGVPRALRTGRAAAEAARDWLDRRECGAIATYEADRDVDCTNYLYERAQYYAYERRWPDSRFWSRRLLAARTALTRS